MNLLSRPVVSSLRREFWPMLRLATPVVVAEIFKVMSLDRVLNLVDDERAALALIEGEGQ